MSSLHPQRPQYPGREQLAPLERQARACGQPLELVDRYPGTITHVTY